MSGVISAGRNSAFLLSNQLLSILIRLAYLFVLARSVSPESYGVLIYALSWYLALLPFTFLGADVVLAREVARARAQAPALLGATLGSRIFTFPVIFVVSSLLAFLLEPNPEVRSLVILFSLALPGRSLWMWTAAVFTAFEETHQIVRFEVTARLLEVGVLLLVLSVVGPDLKIIAAIHALSWLLQGGAATMAVRHRYGIAFSRPSSSWLQVVRDGLPGAAFSIAMAAFFQLPIVLFRQFQGTGSDLGYFALAFQIVAYLMTIPYVVANASLPLLTRSAERRDGKDRIAVIILASIIVVGGVIAVSAVALVANSAVAWVFGVKFASAAIVLANGLWLLIPASLAMLFQQMLFSHGPRSRVATLGPLLGVLTMVALFPLLESWNAYDGPLAAVACGFIVWFALALMETVRMGFFKKRQPSIEVDQAC